MLSPSSKMIFTPHVLDGDQVRRWLSPDFIRASSGASRVIIGNQLWQDLHRWLSPPDPSINYHVASDARREGSTMWFLEGSMFNEWKSTGSLLWIHGKRAHLSHSLLHHLTVFRVL
jgi:hypothetical protein